MGALKSLNSGGKNFLNSRVAFNRKKSMNVFVLNTGRCGSMTFTKACSHIANYTSAHESRCGYLGKSRFDYPENDVEVDNRLSWVAGAFG